MDLRTIAFSSLAVALILLGSLPYLASAGNTNTTATNTTITNTTAIIQSIASKIASGIDVGPIVIYTNTSATATTTTTHSSSSTTFSPNTAQVKAFPVVPVTLAVIGLALVAIVAYLILMKRR